MHRQLYHEQLRNAREFRQYKGLLRRADIALAQAKVERHHSVLAAVEPPRISAT